MAIVNSLDNGIADTIKGPCLFDACSNKFAFNNGELTKNSGQFERLSLISYELGSEAISTVLPVIEIYCHHKHIQKMQLAHAIYSNGSTASLNADTLAELGIKIN